MNLQEDFLSFLITAKKATYAAQGDEASVTPLLQGARQLEFTKGDLLYRDIYFGMSYFVGQETVYVHKNPVWSMSYSGGMDETYDLEFVKEVYAFLRNALREVSFDCPFRGPQKYMKGDFTYSDTHLGKINQFSGRETILFKGAPVYSLHYSGGMIR